MATSVLVTKHAKKRTKERMGLKKQHAQKVSEQALRFGLTHKETKGQLKKFIDGLYLSQENANNIVVYNDKVFLFVYDKWTKINKFITVINLPSQFHALSFRLCKQKKEKIG